MPSLEQKLLEKIDEDEYKRLEEAMNRLIALPYAHEFKDFISEWHVPLFQKKYTAEIIKPKTDQNGRQFVTVYGRFLIFFPVCAKSTKFLGHFSKIIKILKSTNAKIPSITNDYLQNVKEKVAPEM